MRLGRSVSDDDQVRVFSANQKIACLCGAKIAFTPEWEEAMTKRQWPSIKTAWAWKRLFLYLLLTSFLPGVLVSYSYGQEEEKGGIPDTAVSQRRLPRVVAILPFKSEVPEPGLAAQVRKSFYNHFSSKPYIDVELPRIDEKVVHLEKSMGKSIGDLPPKEVCGVIGCDGLIYGRVTDYTKVYAVVYSQLAVEAEVWMVDARTGKEVLRIKDSVRYHGTGLPASPLAALMSAVSAAANLRDIQQIRMVNELCYKLNEKIPSPEGSAAAQGPLIKEVLTNVKEGPFGKNKIIRVGLEGDRGLVATFEIGSFKKGILMKETEPGIYVGDYRVMPGDTARDMPIKASLKRVGGDETEWFDVSGPVTIDTTPPPTVTGVKAKGFPDRIRVSWEPVINTPDLKGYKVLRSEQPLSGFSEIAATELNSVEDKTGRQDVFYYYRVIAFDEAGNESEPQDAVKRSLISEEPIMLTGELSKDTVLSGVYRVTDDVRVPRGLSLTLESETRLMFDAGASLTVLGKLIVKGKESPVEFIPSTEKFWKGVIVEDGTITAAGMKMKGATTALSLTNADGLVEGGVIADNETGISITGAPSATITNSIISRNGRGVELVRTAARIVANDIFQNREGIVAKGFSGEIKENNILDNEVNVTSEDPLKIDANYFGTIDAEEMRVKGVIVTKTYDNRAPGGKIVNAVSDRYRAMSGEERQKKGMELATEADEYFKRRNYGKASALFEEALKAYPTARAYYSLALCYQEIKEDDETLRVLKDGTGKFPHDSALMRALGMLLAQKDDTEGAKKAFQEVLRLIFYSG